MILRLFYAFLRRDAISQISYRLGFLLDLLSILFSVATFYYVAKLFGPHASAALAPYGEDYFPFVLIGIAFSTYQSMGLQSFAQNLRQEQVAGTLESILAAPIRAPLLLLALAQWDFLYATLQVALYLAAGTLFFGLKFPAANVPGALLILTLTLTVFLSLGLFSAAFILRVKRGDPVAWLIAAVSELLGGVYFPVGVLPDRLKNASSFVPMSHALEGLRQTLLKGACLKEVAPQAMALAGFTALLLPLGLVVFSLALKSARRQGSLGHC